MPLDRILVVDDEPLMRHFFEEILSRLSRYEFDIASDVDQALEFCQKQDYDLIFSDMKMPGKTGLDFLLQLKDMGSSAEFVLMTAYGTIEDAVCAMKQGAYDYIMKPVSPDEIELLIERVSERRQLIQENAYLKSEIAKTFNFKQMVGESRGMCNLKEDIRVIAASRSTVLIHGQSGVGKELVARSIHDLSLRKNKPFVKVNCAALSETLLESEMFGHEKGAFTGALAKRIGRFELAHQGTLLLDEISEIPVSLQAKLLRVLQERELERVGGNKTISVDVRIIGTTNRDLRKEIAEGRFREDLYYRLNVIPLEILALKERRDDILLLAETFLEKFNQENSKNIQGFTDAACQKLLDYSWPGNVRELQNVIERAVVMCLQDQISEDLIYVHLQESQSGDIKTAGALSNRPLQDVEKELILNTLQQNNQNKTKASQILQISVRTLRNKLYEYEKTQEAVPV